MGQPFHLAADYSAPYDPWAPGMLRKDQFLRDARRLLRQVAQYLPAGFALVRVNVCAGGPASGGDVYAYYACDPADRRAIRLCLGQSALPRGRADGIVCHACTCRYLEDQWGFHVRYLGLNVWLSPDLDAQELAQAVVDVRRGRYRVAATAQRPDGGPDLLFAYGVHEAVSRRPQQLALW